MTHKLYQLFFSWLDLVNFQSKSISCGMWMAESKFCRENQKVIFRSLYEEVCYWKISLQISSFFAFFRPFSNMWRKLCNNWNWKEEKKRMEEINQHEAPSDLRQHSIPSNRLQSRHTQDTCKFSAHLQKYFVPSSSLLVYFTFFLPKCLSINYRYCCCHSSPISISIYSHSLSFHASSI